MLQKLEDFKDDKLCRQNLKTCTPSPPPHGTIGVHRNFFIISQKQNVHGTIGKNSNNSKLNYLFHGDHFHMHTLLCINIFLKI